MWYGKNFFKNCCCISSQTRMNLDLRFCSNVLALSFNEKGKSFNLMVFMLQLSHYRWYRPPQILSNASMDFLDLSHEKKVKLNNAWLKIKMRCIRGENYAWGCTCSYGIHVVSKCSNTVILIMKRLVIFFGHIFWKWWGYPTKSTT